MDATGNEAAKICLSVLNGGCPLLKKIIGSCPNHSDEFLALTPTKYLPLWVTAVQLSALCTPKSLDLIELAVELNKLQLDLTIIYFSTKWISGERVNE